MGTSSSTPADNMGALADWITERACRDTEYATEFRHLTYGEKGMIDLTIARILATNRRIETKLLDMGREDDHVLDALCWD